MSKKFSFPAKTAVAWLKFLPVGNLVSLLCHVSESEDEDDGSERDRDENNWAVVTGIMQLWFHQVTLIFSVFTVLG